jgi:hypothetical protein
VGGGGADPARWQRRHRVPRHGACVCVWSPALVPRACAATGRLQGALPHHAPAKRPGARDDALRARGALSHARTHARVGAAGEPERQQHAGQHPGGGPQCGGGAAGGRPNHDQRAQFPLSLPPGGGRHTPQAHRPLPAAHGLHKHTLSSRSRRRGHSSTVPTRRRAPRHPSGCVGELTGAYKDPPTDTQGVTGHPASRTNGHAAAAGHRSAGIAHAQGACDPGPRPARAGRLARTQQQRTPGGGGGCIGGWVARIARDHRPGHPEPRRCCCRVTLGSVGGCRGSFQRKKQTEGRV